jgi:hypothetical protein
LCARLNSFGADDRILIGRVAEVIRTRSGEDERVRFDAVEWLHGRGGSRIHVFTPYTRCGYRFRKDAVYLVSATRDRHGREWWVYGCSNAFPLEEAERELVVLRAWRDGRPFPRRLQGRLIDERTGRAAASRLSVQLAGPVIREAAATADFAFTDLPAGLYRLDVTGAGVTGYAADIDLQREACLSARITVEGDADRADYHIQSYPQGTMTPRQPKLYPPPPLSSVWKRRSVAVDVPFQE